MQSTCNVLHTLPNDAFDVVLRHLSQIPRSTNWASYLNPAVVSALGDSGVTALLRQRIHALGTFISSPSDAIALCNALRILRDSCTALDLFIKAPIPLELPLSTTSCVRELALTVETIDAPPSSLLSSFPALRVLRIDAPHKQAGAVYASVRSQCPNLESLHLHIGSRVATGFAAMFASLANLSSLTLTIRDALIADDADTEPLLFAPLLHCPLSELTVQGDFLSTRFGFEAVVLEMPGLRKLTAPRVGASVGFLERLVVLHPDIQVETDVTIMDRTWDEYLYAQRVNPTRIMAALKRCLTGFAFRSNFECNYNEFAAAAANCTALRSLSVTDLGNNDAPIINALFSNPRPQLEELKLAFTCNESIMSSCVRTVATNSGALEALELSGTPLPKTDYHLLTTCNPALRGVRIVMRMPTTAQKESYVLGVLDAFANQPALSTLTVDTFSTQWSRAALPHHVRIRCRNYRVQSINVILDGIPQ